MAGLPVACKCGKENKKWRGVTRTYELHLVLRKRCSLIAHWDENRDKLRGHSFTDAKKWLVIGKLPSKCGFIVLRHERATYYFVFAAHLIKLDDTDGGARDRSKTSLSFITLRLVSLYVRDLRNFNSLFLQFFLSPLRNRNCNKCASIGFRIIHTLIRRQSCICLKLKIL